jgi:uncharacterized 2Fe-2S/4Fe-4S cluster protein (DUF4445 family)
VDTVNELIAALVAEHGISLNEVTAVTCAGNMTMTHLLLRVDPFFIRREPYVPIANFIPVIRAAEAGIKINPRGLLACLPGVASYVGGDITAGVLASGLDEGEGLYMLIDIGTNGEIVLGNREWLVCCAASAGPAFEGSGVHSGVRAMYGAIQKVQIDPSTYQVRSSTIGESRPIGICGSGYVDALAAMFKAGIIDRSGKIRTTLPSSFKKMRIKAMDGEMAFALATAEESATGKDVLITEVDITNLIRSKGAIYTASKVLVDRMGMKLTDLDKFYIGGGFGNYLNIEKAIWIGLLPDLPEERFEFIGNSSLTGARMALLSHDALTKAREIAEKMTYIELSAEPSYMEEYVGSLFLPHTDIDLFPTVKQALRV